MTSDRATGGPAEIAFDRSAASIDAIQRAAYRFCDRLSLEVIPEEEHVRCVLRPSTGAPLSSEDVESFRIEVLDQVLRERIRRETESVRNVILAVAFSEADVHDDADADA